MKKFNISYNRRNKSLNGMNLKNTTEGVRNFSDKNDNEFPIKTPLVALQSPIFPKFNHWVSVILYLKNINANFRYQIKFYQKLLLMLIKKVHN